MAEGKASPGGPNTDRTSHSVGPAPGTAAGHRANRPARQQPSSAAFGDQSTPGLQSPPTEVIGHQAPTVSEGRDSQAATAFAIGSASTMRVPTAQPSPHADYLEQTARHFFGSAPPTTAAPLPAPGFQPDPAWPAPRPRHRVDVPAPSGSPGSPVDSGRHSEYQRQAARHFDPQRSVPSQHPKPPGRAGGSVRWWNIGRDVVAGVLLFLAMLLPWNIDFGLGMGDSNAGIVAILILVTILSWASIAATYAGYWRMFSTRFDPNLVCRIRLALNIPYLLLVGGFVIFDTIETMKNNAGGIGTGAWLGTAGALLAGQPVMTDPASTQRRFRAWASAIRIVAFASIGLAGVEFLVNLGWAVKDASESGAGQIAATLVTSVVAGAVSLGVIALAGMGMLQQQRGARLATIALGAAVLVTGFIVRILPFGAHAFASISQHTSNTDVGYPGYLAWTAAAAILAPATLSRMRTGEHLDNDALHDAGRRCLLLVAGWCAGSAVVQLVTMLASIVGHSTMSVYYGIALFAFDAATAALAGWLLATLDNAKLPAALTTTLCGVLSVLALARLVVSSVLEGAGASRGFAVLDKALPLLALGVLAMMLATSGALDKLLVALRSRPSRPSAAPPVNPPPPTTTAGQGPGAAIPNPPESFPPGGTGTPAPAVGLPPPTGQPVLLPAPAGVVPVGLPQVGYLVGPRPTNGMAIAALVCSLVLAPLGIIFGHISLAQIKRTGEDGRGMAIAGLVIGYLSTVGALIGILVLVGVIGGAIHDIDSSIDSITDSFTDTPTTTYSTIGVPGAMDITMKNASVGDCFNYEHTDNTVTEFSPVSCDSSNSNVEVTSITDDTSDCDGNWVVSHAYSPNIVLCLQAQ